MEQATKTPNTIGKKPTMETLVRTALMTALAAALTMFPQFPTPMGGYVHFGDSIIYLTAFLLGPVPAAFAGGVGHALADGLTGYVLYLVPTFFIKGLLGFCVGKIIQSNTNALRLLLAGVVAVCIVTIGYFVAEFLLVGLGAALFSLVSSPVQCVMNVLAFALLLPLLKHLRR